MIKLKNTDGTDVRLDPASIERYYNTKELTLIEFKSGMCAEFEFCRDRLDVLFFGEQPMGATFQDVPFGCMETIKGQLSHNKLGPMLIHTLSDIGADDVLDHVWAERDQAYAHAVALQKCFGSGMGVSDNELVMQIKNSREDGRYYATEKGARAGIHEFGAVFTGKAVQLILRPTTDQAVQQALKGFAASAGIDMDAAAAILIEQGLGYR